MLDLSRVDISSSLHCLNTESKPVCKIPTSGFRENAVRRKFRNMSKSKADEDFVSVFSSPAKNVKIEGMDTVEKREKVGVFPRQDFRR